MGDQSLNHNRRECPDCLREDNDWMTEEITNLRAQIAEFVEKNAGLLQANRDCLDHFNALKEDFDKRTAALEKVIEWDKKRGLILPYKVRDPIHAALK